MKRKNKTRDVLKEAYETFQAYNQSEEVNICLSWYTEEEVISLSNSEPSEIKTNLAKKMLWESKDHWFSVNSYKRFLPRILEVLSPPELKKDLYPEHIFEVLNHLDFKSWPENEKKVVINFLDHLKSEIIGNYYDDEDCDEFIKSLSLLQKT